MSRPFIAFMLALSTLTAAVSPARHVRAAEAAPHPSAQFVGNAVAGETLSAFPWATANTQPDAAVEHLAAQYRARFVDAPEPGLPTADDPLVATALADYREYWRTVLMSDLPKEQAEAVLEKRVRRLLTAHGYPQEVDGGFTDALQRAIEQRGYHAITGRTLPYLELMVWHDVEDTRYSVQLTDGTVAVPVRFIGGFVSRGWVNFATLGKASAGGWTEDNRLVCVKDDYDLDSEDFRVHYLQHEGRHFADYQRYPKLKSHDLEYRAKLTELVYAESTLRPTLDRFIANGRADLTSAHSYAEYVLVRNLARVLLKSDAPVDAAAFSAVPDTSLKDAAAKLLEEYDRTAATRDPRTLESLIM